MQRNFNTNEFVLFDKDDPVADFANDSQWKGDAHFGLHLYSNNYWLSLSSLQLIQSEFNFSNQATATDLTTLSNARHFYGMGGYRFNEIISEDVDLEPSVLIKYVQGAPVSFEGTVRAFYQDQYWLGLNYRTEDAFGIMLGIELERGLNIAYSYDFITSQISNYSSGSHEITLGYDFNWRGDGPRKVQPFDNSRRKL